MTRKRAKKLLMGRWRFSRKAAECVLIHKPKNVPNIIALSFGEYIWERNGLFYRPVNVVDVDLSGD